jgi:diaminopimelate epimerase
MRFEKWQALGNDYLIVEADKLPFELTPARVRRLCEGHFGVFADGVLELSRPADPEHVANLRIFNPDGSEAELSGNGAREAILYLRLHWTDRDEFAIHTVAGEIRPTITGPDTCRVDMGAARLQSPDFPGGLENGRGTVVAAGRSWDFQHVSIGNPQCAIRIDAEAQFPNRTNVSWYTELAPPSAADGHARIRARIFERGVGETLSSGTGATGAAVAHVLRRRGAGEDATHITVVLDGGELEVEVGEDLGINLTGWARPVFEGRLSDNFVKELNETE